MAIPVYIKEQSFIAAIAAKKLKTEKVALVLGNTIHLWNVKTNVFLQNHAWVNHELTHVQQYQQLGKLKFLFCYLIESIRKGYYHNRFEQQARMNEHNTAIQKQYRFIIR